MKILILWRRITGYLTACVRALSAHTEEVIVFEQRAAPHERADLATVNGKSIPVFTLHPQDANLRCIAGQILDFDPDIILASFSYGDAFFALIRQLKGSGRLIIGALDTYYRGGDAWLGKLLRGKLGLWSCYDCVWVPGYRAREHARLLGFKDDRIFEGLYSCDTKLFRDVGRKRVYSPEPWPRRFLFVGQYIKRKGVDVLVEAYRRYCAMAKEPWTLACIGAGPMGSLLTKESGLSVLGFKPPQDCATEMQNSGALVLPSRRDHWPLVIHEATCTGLPIIATADCGSTTELVQDGCNGWIVSSGEVGCLAMAMKRLADGKPWQMGAISYCLSQRYDPEVWAQRLVRDIPMAVGGTRSCDEHIRPVNSLPKEYPVSACIVNHKS